jgi:hypothetical protein
MSEQHIIHWTSNVIIDKRFTTDFLYRMLDHPRHFQDIVIHLKVQKIPVMDKIPKTLYNMDRDFMIALVHLIHDSMGGLSIEQLMKCGVHLEKHHEESNEMVMKSVEDLLIGDTIVFRLFCLFAIWRDKALQDILRKFYPEVAVKVSDEHDRLSHLLAVLDDFLKEDSCPSFFIRFNSTNSSNEALDVLHKIMNDQATYAKLAK